MKSWQKIFCLSFILGFFVFGIFHFKVARDFDDKEFVTTRESKVVDREITPARLENENRATSTEKVIKENEAEIVIEKETYYFEADGKQTVIDVLNSLASDNSIKIKTKYYEGLGFFIESINNIPNKNGYYWTLYINGRESDVGASNYVVRAGDIIDWRFIKK